MPTQTSGAGLARVTQTAIREAATTRAIAQAHVYCDEATDAATCSWLHPSRPQYGKRGCTRRLIAAVCLRPCGNQRRGFTCTRNVFTSVRNSVRRTRRAAAACDIRRGAAAAPACPARARCEVWQAPRVRAEGYGRMRKNAAERTLARTKSLGSNREAVDHGSERIRSQPNRPATGSRRQPCEQAMNRPADHVAAPAIPAIPIAGSTLFDWRLA